MVESMWVLQGIDLRSWGLGFCGLEDLGWIGVQAMLL